MIVPASGWRGGSPFFHPLEERCRLVEALILRCGHVLTWPIGGHGGPASPAVGVMLGPVSLRTCPAVPQGRTEEWDCRPAHTRHYQMLSSVLLPLCVFIGNVLAFLLHCISFKWKIYRKNIARKNLMTKKFNKFWTYNNNIQIPRQNK